MSLVVIDGNGAKQTISTAADIIAVLAAALPLPTGAATDASLAAIKTLLSGTLAVSNASLPLPAGAATQATLAAILTALGTPAQAGGGVAVTASALPNGAATAAKQDALFSQNAAYTGRAAIVVGGAAVAPGRALEVVATAAGNVSLVLSDNSTAVVPVNVGLSILPYAVKQVATSGTTATATYGVLL